MEKRALIAFILSMVVFIVWGYYLSLQEATRPPVKQAEMREKKKPLSPGDTAPAPGLSGLPETAITEEGAPPMTPSPVEPEFAGTEELIQVDTGLLSMVISNKGGVIHDAIMPKYHEDDGSPINLVKQVPGTPLPLTLESNNETVNRILRNAFFEVSTHSITLSESHPSEKLTLTLNHPSGLQVVREFVFNYNQFLIDTETRITAPSYAQANLEYTVYWGPGLGGEVTSKTNYFAFSGPTTFLNNERVETASDSFTDNVIHKGELEWTGFQNKYFAAVLIPEEGIKNAVTKKVGDQLYTGLQFESVQSAASASHKLYIGTKELQVLENVGHHLARLMDYGWFGNKFAFLVKPLLKVLQFFYSLTHNYGWSIIFLTIIIKIIFFPLTHKSFKSMKGMQKIQPYVKVIQERNKKDRQKMNEEMIELYKKHKVNPLGGCLPMLLQIPVFIALYHALFFSIELRGAPFMGWITDLSKQDPYYVTPIFMGATMFLQQRMTPSVGDPMQQKILLLMPIFFTFLFITFPSGLVIYWTVNNLLTIAQQYYIYKIMKD